MYQSIQWKPFMSLKSSVALCNALTISMRTASYRNRRARVEPCCKLTDCLTRRIQSSSFSIQTVIQRLFTYLVNYFFSKYQCISMLGNTDSAIVFCRLDQVLSGLVTVIGSARKNSRPSVAWESAFPGTMINYLASYLTDYEFAISG